MATTLFHIPNEIAGMPVFGAGLLLIVWAVGSVLLLTWLVWRQGFNADTLGNIPLLLVIGAAIWLLLPKMVEQGKGLPIRGYGVMVLLGMVLGTALAVWRGRQRGVHSELIFSLIFWMFIPGVIGARLFYVIEYWHDFQRATAYETFVEIVKITEGGLVIYGALLGGFLGLVACIRKYRLPILPTFDLLAPSVMLGLALGRIGCLLNGCCFGGVCHLPWAIQFPTTSPPYLHQVEHGKIFLYGLKVIGDPQAPPILTAVEPGSAAASRGLKAGQTITAINGIQIKSVEWAQRALLDADQHGSRLSVATPDTGEVTWPITPPTGSLPVHPAQIYSSINALLICLFLLAIAPFCRRDGTLFALLLSIYPITRFLLEIIRTDEPAQFGTGLSISQNVSLLMLLVAVGVWAYVLRQPPRKTLSMAAHGA